MSESASAAGTDDRAKIVDSLTASLVGNGWVVRTTSAGVLQAVCQDTVSFCVLNRCLNASNVVSKEFSTNVEALVSTIGKELVVSMRIKSPLGGSKRKREEGGEQQQPQRVIEDIRDKIRSTVAKLSKTEGAPPKIELDRATVVLDNTVCLLTAAGVSDERSCQSYGVFFKKLTASDARNRVVLAFRLHAGTPVCLKLLKQCLGECWADGAITSTGAVEGIDSVELPLTEEGALSMKFGNSPILLVTSIDVPPKRL